MKIKWIESRRIANIAEYGLDFVTVTPAIFQSGLVQRASQTGYKVIGYVDGIAVSMIFDTAEPATIELVSLRPLRQLSDEITRSDRDHDGGDVAPGTRDDSPPAIDNPQWTDQELATAKPLEAFLPELANLVRLGHWRDRNTSDNEGPALGLPRRGSIEGDQSQDMRHSEADLFARFGSLLTAESASDANERQRVPIEGASARERRLLAALPVTVGEDGALRVLLVRAPGTEYFIVPMEAPEMGVRDYDVAALAARRQTQRVGRIHRKAFGSYFTWKNEPQNFDVCRVKVYLLEVDPQNFELSSRERGDRRWFTLDEALATIDEPGLVEIIKALPPSLPKNIIRKAARLPPIAR